MGELIPFAVAADRYLATLAHKIARRAYDMGDINRARFEHWLTELAPGLADDRREAVYRALPDWLQGIVEDYEAAEHEWQAERKGLSA
jgi:hypothetical protein